MIALAILRDPVLIVFLFACFLLLVACALRLWIVATRRHVAERRRPERAEPVDLAAEVAAFKHRRDREAAVA